MEPDSLRIISLTDAVIRRYYALSRPTAEFEESVGSLVTQVEKFLSERLKEDISLDIFGSLKSGFGSLNSDVDVCLRFDGDEKRPEAAALRKLMYRIAGNLQQQDFVQEAVPIAHAKVPIVKCEILKPLATSMDISYYNTLALENTYLLATYCAWEPERLPQLGLWVKKWAKAGGICDASVGYISSYACILLLIHYLQKCDPPVLPHLQEDYVQGEELHSSGWNTYFYPIVVPDWSRNKKSAGELFLDFLDYYANFNFTEQIVQIRRKKAMTKVEKRAMEKKWHGRKADMAIEDPFELARNLCGGLGRNKFKRIRTYFERSAEILREAIESIDIAVDDVDFKSQLDEVLEKCYVSGEENKMKGKEKGGRENGKGKNARKQRQKNKEDGAGSAAIRRTNYERKAVAEIDALLEAMYLGKENFPALRKEGADEVKKQSPGAEYWKKFRAKGWEDGRNELKQFRRKWELKRINEEQSGKKNAQANGLSKPAPPKPSKAERKALHWVQLQKNGPVKNWAPQESKTKRAHTNQHPQTSHQKQAKGQNNAAQQVSKNAPAKRAPLQETQAKNSKVVAPSPQQNLSKAQRKALNKIQAEKTVPAPQQKKPASPQTQNGPAQNPAPQKNQQQQKKNSQMVVPPPQQNLSKAQRKALNKIEAEKTVPAPQQEKPAPPQAQNGSVQNPMFQQKQQQKKTPQDPANAASAPPPELKTRTRRRKKKAKNAASNSNSTPNAPTTASAQ